MYRGLRVVRIPVRLLIQILLRLARNCLGVQDCLTQNLVNEGLLIHIDPNIHYSNAELKKLEQSIQKLKDSMKSSDSIRNTKTLDQKDPKQSTNFEQISSGKYWAQKITSLGTKENDRNTRLQKLGGQTANLDTIKLTSRISDAPAKSIFGISTYRASGDDSLDRESCNDTLERACEPDIKALNSSRNKYDPSFIFEKDAPRQSSDKKKLVLVKDSNSFKKPMYCIANTIKSFNGTAKEIETTQKSSRNTNSFMNKVRAKNEKQINNKDYFSFSSPAREGDKENGQLHQNFVKN